MCRIAAGGRRFLNCCAVCQVPLILAGYNSFVETTALIVGKDDSGRKLVNNYVFTRNLGRGSFGKVKLCEKDGKM
jgi:hypothetical protein